MASGQELGLFPASEMRCQSQERKKTKMFSYPVYFKVTAMCGHVGRGRYVSIDFPVRASSEKEAVLKVRSFSRVKKGRKDAILEVSTITRQEFDDLRRKNSRDPYLRCHCRSDQARIPGFSERIRCCAIVPSYHKGKRELSEKYLRYRREGRYPQIRSFQEEILSYC